MIIDAYGFRSTTEGFLKRERKAADFVTSLDGNKTYLRFSTEELGPIWEIDSAAGTIRWTIGEWADRENLAYETDVNTPLEADAGSIEV